VASLGRFGEQAKSALSALRAALKDPDGDVRRNARQVLKRLDPKSLP
jgi:hypothetical protein